MLLLRNYSLAKYQSIQVMRGIACLLVIAFHASLQLKEYYRIDLPGHLFTQGYAGVDLFFVISGFVIAHSSCKLVGKTDMVSQYFVKRFVRIYPLYWIVLIFSIVGLLLTVPGKIPTGNPATIFVHWLTVVLLLPNHEAVNAVSWSLSHELYFYALFSLIIISRRFWIILAFVVLITLAGMSGLHLPTSLGFYFSPFNVEFFAGSLVWYVSRRIKPSVFLSAISIVTGVLIVALFHENSTNENHVGRVVIFGSASSFFLFGFLEIDKIRRTSYLRFMSDIGDASYTLYLFHLPYLIAINRFIKAFTKDQSTILDLTIILFVSVIFLSIYLHNRLEKPLTNWLLTQNNPETSQNTQQLLGKVKRGLYNFRRSFSA